MNQKIRQIVKYLAVALVSSAITLAVVVTVNYEDIYFKHLIETKFYGDVDMQNLETVSKKAMVTALGDEHTYYIDEEEGYDNFTGQATGNYTGIGIAFVPDEKGIRVTYVMGDSPAEKSGILAGDVIVGVDGKNIQGLDTNGISSLVRGEKGTHVIITVLRNGEKKDIDVKRDFIKSTSVTSEKFGDVGYIHLNSFDDDSHVEMRNHIDKMGDIKGLVVDLRNNPGGLLTTAVETLEMFIDEGKLIEIRYKDEKNTTTFSASGKQLYKMPLVVLVNGNSASASEIFAAAIKDNHRGICVGTTTYGKGSVQRLYSLGNDTGLSLTIARFFSPAGNEINKVGVTPDIEVNIAESYRTRSVSEIPRGDDAQLQTALAQFK